MEQNAQKVPASITDCWNELVACETIPEIKAKIKEFPPEFGEWSVGEKDGKMVIVNNLYHDQEKLIENEEEIKIGE